MVEKYYSALVRNSRTVCRKLKVEIKFPSRGAKAWKQILSWAEHSSSPAYRIYMYKKFYFVLAS